MQEGFIHIGRTSEKEDLTTFVPTIKLVVQRLDDHKSRIRENAVDTLFVLSRQPCIGAGTVLQLVAEGCVKTSSGVSTATRLNFIKEIVFEFGMKECSENAHDVVFKRVLIAAIRVYDHRDPNTRDAALDLIRECLKVSHDAQSVGDLVGFPRPNDAVHR